ncbi:MAG: carboxypeptidase regulatory-like domain-containing protein, partial [Acidobacteria bacterium]|nr:carboxypeptidase regulatory-like domain-containing protein [Acidobacteriota bacterium]
MDDVIRRNCMSLPVFLGRTTGWFMAALILLSLPAAAQQAGARLEGTVRDSQALAIPGVLIVATHQLTNVATETYTNEAGIYVYPFLFPGPYAITAELAGFKKSSVSDFVLETATTKVANFTLQIGDISEVVSVTAESVQQVQLSTSDLGTVFSDRKIKDLPLLSRRAIDLVFLEPGMSGLSAMGGRTGNNSLSMDGVEITSSELGTSSGLSIATDINPSVDTIDEFRVITGNPSAEYGRESGFKVELTTKSGANDLHGSAYEFFRGRVLNANGFWNNANPLTAERRALTRHLFGGTIGGPVYIPGVYNGRNRTFFFFNYEGTRQGETINVTRTVLTKELREGVYRFITSGVTKNPETGAVLTQNNRVVVDPKTGAIRPGVVGIQSYNMVEADIKNLDGIGADKTG